MTRAAALLSLALVSALLSWPAAGSSILCSRTQVLPDREVRYSFLRRASSPSPRLYYGAWSRERALLSCAWSDDEAVIDNYISVCRERAHEFSDHPDETIDVESVLAAEDLCVGGHAPAQSHRGQAERSEVTTHRRVKRGFIVPGTLWCGSGNKAPSYDDLGVFSDTDSCCREHDQCKHTIPSFHSQFGVFNSNIFTMSHCDCDNKFHSCLVAAQDSISEVVGYTFFNLLKMHCFELSHRLQCTERNWFGMCKDSKMSLYAEVHPPKLYDSPNATEVSVNATEMLGTSNSTGAAASTSPPEGLGGVGNTLPTWLNITEKQQSECAIFKELDECRNKIRPQQKKYGLFNPEARTLYHCNCTSRLFQTLAKQRRLSAVQALLLDRVSESCFLQPDCAAGKM
ncbi:group 3 secretory phospholipase A2 isoform X2 [Clinocottus analis]|uniref:group 3 secretory phospholipase A2 isoform X2 n=1 Tax=Clinocottus analis TaxID=304258 RepID=UPI0035C13B0B